MLTIEQKKYINELVLASLSLSAFEFNYLTQYIKDKVLSITGVDVLTINMNWPSFKELCKTII